MKTGERVIEGGAIRDRGKLSCEEYGARMYGALAQEYPRFAGRAISILNLPQGGRILEIGPEPGWAGIELGKLRPDIAISAVDASSDMIRAARKNAQEAGLSDRVSYMEGVAEDLSRFETGSFDAIISRDSLHHWIDPAKAFGEMERVLAANGRIYIEDERRDLGFAERILVKIQSSKIGADMSQGWQKSISASWTPVEIRKFFPESKVGQWNVRPVFLGLEITRKRRLGAS